MKARAAVAWEPKKPLEIEEVEVEGPREGEVLLRVHATGVCHTDAFTLSGEDPTYSGCPATEVIAASICDALEAAGASKVHIETQLSPPWTTDWLAPEAAEKLRAYGIAPPGKCAMTQTLRFVPPAPACPRCGEKKTTRVSEFGSTACKAFYRCPSCLEPFEYFKPI